jgi:elastase-2
MKKMIRNKKFRVVALISFLTTTFLISIFFSKVIFTPVNTTEAFIIDGVEHDESEFPNVARLFAGDDTDFCTGTLIDSTHVLTAAHCLVYSSDGEPRFSTIDIKARLNGEYYQSKAMYVHSTYLKDTIVCSNDDIDAAIIELSEKVPESVAKPVPLNSKKIPVGAELVLAGYGLTGDTFHSAGQGSESPSLGKINVGTNTFDGYGFYNTDHTKPISNSNSNYFYWDFDLGESNVAFGDSGGPVFYNNAVAGIPSCGGGDSEGRPFGLGGHLFATRVDKIIPWINNVLAGKVKPTPDPVEPPFVYDDGGGFKFTFTDFVTINSKEFFIDVIEYNSWLKDDGTYNLMVFAGVYGGKGLTMGYYNAYIKNPNKLSILYKKKGTSNYVEQLKITKRKSLTTPWLEIVRGEVGSYESPESAVPPGEYTISVFIDGKAITSTDVCLPSATSKAGNKIGNITCPKTPSQNNTANGPQALKDFTANGITATDSQTINETETTSFVAADQQQFLGTSTKYSEINMNGSLTPLIEGDDLSIDGSLTYSYKTVPVNDINKGGKISVQLVDGDGNKSKIVPMNVVPAGEITEYNKPYFFNPTFDNYRRFLGENGKPVTADRKGPFTLNITDDVLGIKIIDIPVVDVVISGDMEAFNEGGGMAPESENTNPSDTLNDPASQNNVNNPSDGVETKKGLLRNPLRKGLDSIPDIVAALVKNIVIPIAIPFLALSIIYTGFLFIQARGNKEKLVKAKEALKWTLIGGAIILASYVIATALQGTIADIIR